MESDSGYAALRAEAVYNPAHASGASVDSLVGKYVLNAAKTWIVHSRGRRHRDTLTISLETPVADGLVLGETLAAPDVDHDERLEQAGRLALIREIATGLPYPQHRAIEGVLDGQSCATIARQVRVSRQAINEALQAGIVAIRRELANREHAAAAQIAFDRITTL